MTVPVFYIYLLSAFFGLQNASHEDIFATNACSPSPIPADSEQKSHLQVIGFNLKISPAAKQAAKKPCIPFSNAELFILNLTSSIAFRSQGGGFGVINITNTNHQTYHNIMGRDSEWTKAWSLRFGDAVPVVRRYQLLGGNASRR